MKTRDIRPGALIEMPPTDPVYNPLPSRLYVESIKDGRVIFRGGKGTTASARGRWWRLYADVKEKGKLIE